VFIIVKYLLLLHDMIPFKGIDYSEVFASVARHDTIRTVLTLAAQKGCLIFLMDVQSAFLHGDLEEQVFVDQPLGYVKVGNGTCTNTQCNK